MKLKVLNCYAGIGGNRKLWQNVDVTAIENNPKVAEIYQSFFPQDKVIVADAHKYLLEHFEEYDFIWSSPPCPSHSRIRNIAGVGGGNVKPIYPDMKLYEEIIFLNHVYRSSGTEFKGKYVIENVRSYYRTLIEPQEIGMHYFWANFLIPKYFVKTRGHRESKERLKEIKGFDVEDRLMLRNCVQPEVGEHILKYAINPIETQMTIGEI